jgi:transposase
VHHSKPVKKWVEEHKNKIELFYLPSYSPELNPEERLNADLKLPLFKGSGTHQGQTENSNNRTHADIGKIT